MSDIVEELKNRYMDTKCMIPCYLEHRAANEIESLRQQLADSESERLEQARLLGMSGEREIGLLAEIERLKRGMFDTEEMRGATIRDYEELLVQLAASQAREQQLLKALNTAADKFHDYAEYHSMKDQTRDNIEKVERNLSLAKMCDEALALPTDTSALDRIKAEYEAQIQRLREALEDANDFVERHSNRWDGINGKHPCTVVESSRKALALPQDTTALEAMIAEAGEVMRDRCLGDIWYMPKPQEAIRALPGVTLEDLK